ncbi:amidase amiA2 [Mycobacterium tuberculosis T17]|nr:amidase amiA2 [Mycobacterium tuberculosis T17]
MVGASGSDAGAISGSGNQRLPTLTDLLYQLATRAVTSEELVRRSLRAIDVSQPTLNAFRVVLTESALADAAAADKRRAAGDTAPLLGIPIAVKGRRRRCWSANRLRHPGLCRACYRRL